MIFIISLNKLSSCWWLEMPWHTCDVTVRGRAAGYLMQSGSFKDPLNKHGLTLIPAWRSKYIHQKLWDEITYPFPNFNGATVEDWEWISNFIPHFTGCEITYPCYSCRIKTGSGGVCCHNARGRVRNRKSNPDGVAGGIWRTVRTSPSALWQQTLTDRS